MTNKPFMKRLFIASMVALSLITNAQDKKKNIDPKYVFCYKQTSLETDDYKIYIEDALNENALCKFKIRIFNKTNDYLIFKPSDVLFKIGKQEIASKEKQIIILPNEEGWKVIDVKGGCFQETNYTVELKSMYKISANSPALKVEDFNLPASKNEVMAGNFKCNLKKADLNTAKSILKFECTYTGDAIGILAPNKCIAKMPKGIENTNANRFKGCLLEKGKTENFVLEFREMKGGGDMQKNPFKLIWGDTFKESKIEPIKGGTIKMELDQAKTTERNQ